MHVHGPMERLSLLYVDVSGSTLFYTRLILKWKNDERALLLPGDVFRNLLLMYRL